MLKDHGRRLTGIRRRTLVMAAMALIVPVTALASASPAMAEPKGIFAKFKECPTEIPGLSICTYNVSSSGEFKIGNTSVPINKNIIQQGGGIKFNPANGAEFALEPAKNGESISKTELNVPGGLTGLIKCEEITGSGPVETYFRELCKKTLEHGVTEVTATAETVANEKNPAIFNSRNLIEEEGAAITLPLRVHLKNTFLGNNCYIGSESSPIELHLTTGETHPPAGFKSIRGKLGEAVTLEENELVSDHITDNSLVDNDYAAPGTEGCGEVEIFGYKVKGFLDSLVNGKIGIPNKAGENTAILNGELNSASAKSVIESEKF
jgi:hypothetical protein